MKTSDVAALVLGLALAAACAPLPVLAPGPNDAAGCHPYTEHDCAGGGCCLDGWVCGGKQPDAFVTCPEGQCCNSGDTGALGMGAEPRMRTMLQRRP
jgi:hypothetical protein